MAQAQRREGQTLQVRASDQRIMCQTEGRGWLAFPFAHLSAVYVDLAAESLVCQFQQGEPLMLEGPVVPKVAVLAIAAAFGTESLRGHPDLAALDH